MDGQRLVVAQEVQRETVYTIAHEALVDGWPTLQRWLDELGFHVAGFGCATCMGNSGDLAPVVSEHSGGCPVVLPPARRARS